MKVDRNGVTRIVLLTKKYAIKIPRLNNGWYLFIQGIYSNLSEASCWNAMKTMDCKTLCPTIFSFAGIINVMPRIEICTSMEQIEDYPREDREDHKPRNYGIYNGNVVCVDYPYYKIKINIMSDIKKQPSTLALETAAQAWCAPETETIIMNEKLAFEFANILDKVWNKPYLGNAITKELLEELQARAEVGGYAHYKTVEK